jgi:hypothetical protein
MHTTKMNGRNNFVAPNKRICLFSDLQLINIFEKKLFFKKKTVLFRSLYSSAFLRSQAHV